MYAFFAHKNCKNRNYRADTFLSGTIHDVLHNCLHNGFIADFDLMHADFLILIKIKAKHIAFVLVIIVQIIGKLLLAPFVVLLAVLDFQLNNKLLAAIINDNVRAPCVPCLRLKIVVSCAVDNGL